MERSLKLLVLVTLTASVMAGVSLGWAGESWHKPLASLHVFLFNLTAGGLLVTSRVSGFSRLKLPSVVFYLVALLFCAGAFFSMVPIMIASAFILGALVEQERWRKFSWFPRDFFRRAPVSRKFEQAAILCFSLGLFICAATLLNNHYLHLVHFDKLDLHVFYLGFSFPISLMNFSFIFERVEKSAKKISPQASEFCFWALNLGVIAFFFFIIFEIYPLQLVAAFTLLSVVLVTIHLHWSSGSRDRTWTILASSLAFLVIGSITGVIYILILWRYPGDTGSYALGLHSAATLFGWNLSWIILAVSGKEPPGGRRPALVLVFHWAFVGWLPLARVNPIIGLIALAVFLAMIFTAFFSVPPDRRGALS